MRFSHYRRSAFPASCRSARLARRCANSRCNLETGHIAQRSHCLAGAKLAGVAVAGGLGTQKPVSPGTYLPQVPRFWRQKRAERTMHD